MKDKIVDIQITNEGSVFQFFVLTAKAKEWVNKYLALEGWQWIGDAAFCVEHRYAVGIAQVMKEAGLKIV